MQCKGGTYWLSARRTNNGFLLHAYSRSGSQSNPVGRLRRRFRLSVISLFRLLQPMSHAKIRTNRTTSQPENLLRPLGKKICDRFLVPLLVA